MTKQTRAVGDPDVQSAASPPKAADVIQPDEADILAEQMRGLGPQGELLEKLVVDNRVFARITDGIYRRPSSALRELIFNAYDADATEVIVHTDSPRFTRMEIVDNGNGMNERSLSNLLKHIGGSSKRTHRGREIGTASADNPDLSPGKRRLIGKIGVGIFAVAHLTTHFQIITKARGEKDWLIAEIWLKTFTEELLRDAPEAGSKPEFVTGEVRLSRELANSADVHGTTVTLFDIRPSTQDILRRRELWESILDLEANPEEATGGKKRNPPDVHIGFTDRDQISYRVLPNVPWDPEDLPETRFRKFYESVATASQEKTKNPDIEEFLDEYFAMIWRLSLAAPLRYLDRHPLKTPINGGIDVYEIENQAKGRAKRVERTAGITIAEKAALSLQDDPVGAFNVFVDGIKLFRPVELSEKIAKSPRPSRQPAPLLFVGKVNSSLGNFEASRSGGPLEFEAYFYWNTVIVPKQNRGVLIRINEASGVLYDDRFLDYQVSELNRLNQITGEIFIKVGMDAALNIDRESFNVSHPHYQYLSKWVHSSVRQITNLLKEVSKKGLDEAKDIRVTDAMTAVDEELDSIWAKRADPLEERPEIVVGERSMHQPARQLRLEGGVAYDVSPVILKSARTGGISIAEIGPLGVAKAIFSVLAAYGVLEKMDYRDQESMFEDVLQMLMAEARK